MQQFNVRSEEEKRKIEEDIVEKLNTTALAELKKWKFTTPKEIETLFAGVEIAKQKMLEAAGIFTP